MGLKKCLLEESEIINRYMDGESSREICVGSGISERAIRNILKKHDVPMRSAGSKRKWEVNEEFFDNWSNEMAYVLGFAFADSTATRLYISFFQKESAILEEIKKAMQSTAPITKDKHGMYYLAINSKRICEKLKEFNLIGNKTYTKKMPNIPKEYQWDFIRGFFDGDGHINEDGNYVIFSCCSENFSFPLFEMLRAEDLNCELKVLKKTIRVIVSGYESLYEMRCKMYANSGNLFIKRKRGLFANRVK